MAGDETQATDILLVHGAWHGAWCWNEMIPVLAERGIHAVAIDLPGHGTRSPEVSSWNGYVQAVLEALRQFTRPPLVVGHSMGGGVIASAAELVPDMIKAITFVCAFIPSAGESIMDLARQSPPAEGLVVDFESGAATFSRKGAEHTFYHDCSDPCAWAALLQPQSLAPVMEVTGATPDRSADLPRHYVRCSADRAISPELQTMMLKRANIGSVYDLSTGHSPFIAAPHLLADILVGVHENAEAKPA